MLEFFIFISRITVFISLSILCMLVVGIILTKGKAFLENLYNKRKYISLIFVFPAFTFISLALFFLSMLIAGYTLSGEWYFFLVKEMIFTPKLSLHY